jgi:hypothetical protein
MNAANTVEFFRKRSVRRDSIGGTERSSTRLRIACGEQLPKGFAANGKNSAVNGQKRRVNETGARKAK